MNTTSGKPIRQAPAVVLPSAMAALQRWRNADHEDSILLSRDDVATLVEEVCQQLADAKAAQAMVVERCMSTIQAFSGSEEEADYKAYLANELRALADTDGLALVQALRAEATSREMEWAAIRDEIVADRDRLAAANAALEAQLQALRLQLDQKDALYDSGFQAGVKLGWNFGVSGDEAGFQAATSSTEHVAELKRIRAAAAHRKDEETPK